MYTVKELFDLEGGHTLAAEFHLYAAEQRLQNPGRFMINAGHAENQRAAEDQQRQRCSTFLKPIFSLRSQKTCTHRIVCIRKITLQSKIIASVPCICKIKRCQKSKKAVQYESSVPFSVRRTGVGFSYGPVYGKFSRFF